MTEASTSSPGVLSSRHVAFPSLNGLRAISISMVVFGHMFSNSRQVPPVLRAFGKRFMGMGALGVTIFFVLSGFLITSLLVRERELTGSLAFGKFYARRFFRLMPVLVLYLVVLAVSDYLSSDVNISLADYLQSLLYFQNLQIWPHHWLTSHLWSLSVEEQFYLVWPLCFLRFGERKYLLPGLLVLAILANPFGLALIHLQAAHPSLPSIVKILGRFSEHLGVLAMGCFVAFHLQRVGVMKSKGAVPAIFLAMAWLSIFLSADVSVSLSKLNQHTNRFAILVAISFVILYSIACRDTAYFRILNSRPFNYVGKLSYSLYIWQQFFLTPADQPYSNVWYRTFPYCFLALAATAILSYELYEKAFLKLKARFDSY